MSLVFDDHVEIGLRLNGREVRRVVSPRTTLLDWLREDVGLTGAKKGCNEGACGTCTVLVDGRPMNSCLTLVVQCEGLEITTVEGLAADDGTLSPVQQAFRRPRRVPVRLLHAGPAAVGDRVHRRRARDRRGHGARVDEREHLPVLGLSADHGGGAGRRGCAGGTMRDFAYARADSLATAVDAASVDRAALLAGGTELLNWFRLGITAPERVVDIGGLDELRGIQQQGVRAAHRCARHAQRGRRAPARRRPRGRAGLGVPAGGVRAGAQPGHPRRQRAATHALRVLPRGGAGAVAVQQAGAGQRVRRVGRTARAPRDLRLDRGVRRGAAVRSGGRAGGAGRPGRRRRTGRATLRSRCASST